MSCFFFPPVLLAHAANQETTHQVNLAKKTESKAIAEESLLHHHFIQQQQEHIHEASECMNSQALSKSLDDSGSEAHAWKIIKALWQVDRSKEKPGSIPKGGFIIGATALCGCVYVARKKSKDEDDAIIRGVEDKSTPMEAKRSSIDKIEDGPIPLNDAKHVDARNQPKSPKEEEDLANRYGNIDDVGERAFQILLDLGMIVPSTGPK